MRHYTVELRVADGDAPAICQGRLSAARAKLHAAAINRRHGE